MDEEKLLKIFNILREVAWHNYKDIRRNKYNIAEDDKDNEYWLKAPFNAKFDVLGTLAVFDDEDVENFGDDVFEMYE